MIKDLKLNIHGWNMRIMQLEESIYNLDKRLREITIIKNGQKELLKECEKK